MSLICRVVVFALSASCICVSGCADPLTKHLNKMGYSALVPAPERAHLGDLYHTANIARDDSPYKLLSTCNEATATSIMARARNPVAIPNTSGEEKFELKGSVSVLNKLELELEAHRVSKFSITISGAEKYVLESTSWNGDILPAFQECIDGPETDGKYVIRGLLRVASLKYTFYDSTGAKVNVKVPAIQQAVDVSLGANWQVTNNGELEIKPDAPKFIGFKLARIKGEAFNPLASGAAPQPVEFVDLPKSAVNRQN